MSVEVGPGGWDQVKSGLELMIIAWLAEVALTVANWFIWPILESVASSVLSSRTGFEVVNLVMEVGYTVAAAVLIVAATKVMKFPPVVPKEPPPGDPYRGNMAPQASTDGALDRLSSALLLAFASGLVVSLVSYVTNLLRSSEEISRTSVFSTALRYVSPIVFLAAGVLFALWAARAARLIGKPIAPALPVILVVTVVTRAALSVLRTASHARPSEVGLPIAGLLLSLIGTVLSVVMALGVIAAIRGISQPAGRPFGGPVYKQPLEL